MVDQTKHAQNCFGPIINQRIEALEQHNQHLENMIGEYTLVAHPMNQTPEASHRCTNKQPMNHVEHQEAPQAHVEEKRSLIKE